MFALRYASKLEKQIFFPHSGYQVNVSTFSKYVYTATRILMISVNFAFAFCCHIRKAADRYDSDFTLWLICNWLNCLCYISPHVTALPGSCVHMQKS